MAWRLKGGVAGGKRQPLPDLCGMVRAGSVVRSSDPLHPLAPCSPKPGTSKSVACVRVGGYGLCWQEGTWAAGMPAALGLAWLAGPPLGDWASGHQGVEPGSAGLLACWGCHCGFCSGCGLRGGPTSPLQRSLRRCTGHATTRELRSPGIWYCLQTVRAAAGSSPCHVVEGTSCIGIILSYSAYGGVIAI